MKKLLFAAIAAIGMTGILPAVAQETGKDVSITTHTYAIKDNDSLKLDIYLREDLVGKENLPVMLYVHGGGFKMGSRKNAAQEVFLRHFADQGFLGASIDYRLGALDGNPYGCKSLMDIFRLATADMADATRYIIDNFKVDPTKIVTSGGSAGAMTVLQMEYDICNDKDYLKASLPEGFNYAGVIPAAGAICTDDNKEPVWPRKPCPMLIMHGSNDPLVPLDTADVLGTKLFGSMFLHGQFKADKVPHWLYIEKGADHIVAMKHLTDNLEETEKFYRSFINDGKDSIVVTEWQDAEPASMACVNAMIKNAPLYILGYDKYLNEIDFNNLGNPSEVVY